MRELSFKKQGYLWRLASVYGPLREWQTETDICTYWRAVLTGIGVFMLCLSLAAAVSVALGDALAFLLVVLQVGWTTPGGGTVMFLTLLVGFTSLFVGMACLEQYQTWTSKRKTRTFIEEAYISWKDRTCVRVKLED